LAISDRRYRKSEDCYAKNELLLAAMCSYYTE
jgi:hypothetical protein